MCRIVTKKIVLLAVVVAIMACSVFSVSCKTQLKYENGIFYCSKTKVTYKELDFQYLPVSISKEKYGELNENGTVTDIFSIENISPEKWLATADGRVFCALGEKVPTLDEMAVNKILICKEGTELTISIAEITSPESISTIVGSLAGNVKVDYPERGEAAELMTLRFSSSEYPWLYYNVSYVEFEKDVIITDYVSDYSTYVEREIDSTVQKNESFVFDCWYKLDTDGEQDRITKISEDSGIPCATITKVNSEGGKDNYIGLLFSDITDLEEGIQTVLEQYEGEFSETDIRESIGTPDMTESSIAVEYNYGKHLIYDRAAGKCVKAPEILQEYKNLTRYD